jgi:hypothetical protein
VIVGEMPLLDSRMKNCQTLARAAGARTYGKPGVISVKAFEQEFSVYHYGFIRAGSAKRIVSAGGKTLGCTKKLDKGSLTLLCFDPSARGDSARQRFLADLLLSLGETPVAHCSDPGVHLFLSKFEKYAVLYLVTPPSHSPLENGHSTERDVIVSVDLAKVKLRGHNLKMVELFGGETIKTTVKDLKTGIVVRVRDYQSYAWWLERKV